MLMNLPEETISLKRNHNEWTIRQTLGHLIDSASNNHQRIIRLQYNENLIFPDYGQDNDLWVELQDYQHTNWNNLVQFWKFYNLHMIQLINQVDEMKLKNYWYTFNGTKVTLQEMIQGYFDHLQLHMDEIRDLIKS